MVELHGARDEEHLMHADDNRHLSLASYTASASNVAI